MATVYRLDENANGPPESELTVLREVGRLGPEWHIFHSVRWQSLRSGRQADGEADFLVVNRHFGVLVLEVKGGGVSVEGGRWLSKDRTGRIHRIKNPYAQAADSKYALLRFLEATTPTLSHVRVGHGVIFPDIDAAGHLGVAATRAITIFSEDLGRLEQCMINIFEHWGTPRPFSSSDLSRLIAMLAPTVTVERTLDVAVRRAEAQIVRLTEDQQRVFDRLRGIPRLIVSGGPGTGKTLLAAQRARLLAAQGGKVRLVCYNELLSRNLRKQLECSSTVEVTTFHSLCTRTLISAGQKVLKKPHLSWWESDGPHAMLAAMQQSTERVDALIVDEGQDFSPLWFSALAAGLADPQNGLMYVFADDRQELWRRSWRDGLPNFGEFSLWENCRNTAQIATCVNAVYSDAPAETGAVGAPVVVVRYGVDDDLVSTVLALGARLVDDHNLGPSELTILTDDAALAARLQNTYILDTPIVNFGGNGIVCETVSRFKGLESPAVLLALGRTATNSQQRLASAYIGLSRARAAAIVVIPEEHPAALNIYSAAQRK